ncbi:FtsW/RodA/SpoVE family cell cycle protein [Schlesneria sp.]|uniref:FtsW/RodA/SpoVE family cell cycle protein n=1 Tax=Schlesneria sp. TaxID=2762018 RepID=UPI002F1ED1AB
MDLCRQLFVAFAALLLGFGLLMVHSASVTSWPTEYEQVYLSRHLIFLTVGLLSAYFAATRDPEFWKSCAPWLFVATVILLILVLIPGVGVRVKGAQRWIRVPGMTAQPSELAKIAVPLMMCWILDRNRHLLSRWVQGTVPFLLPVVLTVPLVLIEPDLGTSLFLLASAALVLFMGGWPLRNFLLGLAVGIPTILTTLAMKPYQQRRIVGFIESWTNFENSPYQLKQSLVTLGAGGLHGVGLGRGWQKLSFLPEANTDFVFAVIGEELGLIGGLSLIALWCGLYLSGLRMISHLDRSRFGFLIGFTLLTQLAGQAMLNIAVVTAMVPPKGISHPLISAGGSNLVVSLLAIGIVLSVSRDDPLTLTTDESELTD